MKTNIVGISSETRRCEEFSGLQSHRNILLQKISPFLSTNRNDMKLLTLLLLLLLCVAAKSQAFYGGVALGGVTSQVDGDHRAGWDKMGFTAGAFVGLPLNNTFSIQMELKYIQKGSHSDADNFVHDDPFSLKLDYIELPILVSANLNALNINGHSCKWLSFELGASLDALARHKESINGSSGGIPNYWKRLSFSSLIGIKFTIKEKYEMALRSINSITSVYNGNLSNENSMRFGKHGAFNDVLEVVLFYRF